MITQRWFITVKFSTRPNLGHCRNFPPFFPAQNNNYAAKASNGPELITVL